MQSFLRVQNMIFFRNFFVILSAVVLMVGCAIVPIDVPVKVYNITNGDVFNAVFKWTGRQGSVSAIDSKGSRCNGEYFTVSGDSFGQSNAWGSIYGYGSTGFTSSSGTYQIMRGAEKGTAILRCEDRNVLQCEYIVNRDNHVAGYCTDNRSNKYRFNY
jgi:hypothetical protein